MKNDGLMLLDKQGATWISFVFVSAAAQNYHQYAQSKDYLTIQ